MSTGKLDNNFNPIQMYGDNYNISPYRTDDKIIIIRDGIFSDIVDYHSILKCEFDNCITIDKVGNELNVHSRKGYIELKSS